MFDLTIKSMHDEDDRVILRGLIFPQVKITMSSLSLSPTCLISHAFVNRSQPHKRGCIKRLSSLGVNPPLSLDHLYKVRFTTLIT